MAVQWHERGVADLTIPELQNLRKNALRTGSHRGCCALRRRRVGEEEAREGRQARQRRAASVGRYVIGFDFVARADKGVTVCPDGTFWSGIWIVAGVHSERAPKVGAYLALHETKAVPSYRQGLITDWRRGTRAEGKIGEGMEFLVRPTDRPYDWVGAGTGEKGYRWSG